MRAEEFTRVVRERVRATLRDHVRFVLRTVDDDTRLQGFIEDPGATLAAKGLAPRASAPQINDLILAIHKCERLHAHMREAMRRYEADQETTQVLRQLASDPATVPRDALERTLDKLLSDEYLVSSPMKILFEDPGVRLALRLPPSLTFENFIQALRRSIRESNRFEDIAETSKQLTGQDIAFVIACTEVAVCVGATVLALLHAVVAAVTYVGVYAVATKSVVFTVSGPTDANNGPVLADDTSAPSSVINNLRHHVWLVVEYSGILRRVALPPGTESRAYGIPAVKALLVGGEQNPLGAIVSGPGRAATEGAYIVGDSPTEHCSITIEDSEDGVVVKQNDAQLTMERLNRAGWQDSSDFNARCTDLRGGYAMSRIAAVSPASIDLRLMQETSRRIERFYTSLRMEAWARTIGFRVEHG